MILWNGGDVCSCNNYDISDPSVRIFFDTKLCAFLICQRSWPAYAPHAEDLKFRDSKWTEKHGDIHLMLWDDTNDDFNFKPSLSHIQRLTCSSHYGGNCAKGECICNIADGWELETCGRGLSDSECMTRKIKNEHYRDAGSPSTEWFVEWKNTSFFIVLDKGYRVTQHIIRHSQKVI